MIEFNKFSCYYKHKKELNKVLDEIDLTVPTGEFLVVLGESGSGKTTMLKCCLGLAEYYEGELNIDGITIEDVDTKSSNFAYVRQDISLYPGMTVYDNIAFPLRNMKTPQSEIDVRVKQIADRLGISYLLTRKPKQLSGGQQQRVAIARAIVKNPRYIFFDEPFSNVDPKLRHELRELVKELHADLQPTVIFVTHDISEAISLAQRIAVIENGRIVEEGVPDELMKKHKSDLLCAFFGDEVSCDE